MKARRGLLGLGVFAGGVLAGMLAEEALYRRELGGPDPEAGERFGDVGGEPLTVESFDGTRIHARVFGPPGAPGVVFCHGFTLDHTVWHYQLRELAAEGRLRLVAVDARGHGRSGPARGPEGTTAFRASTLARDLHAVLSAADVRPAVVVGHSMGGMLAQAFASLEEEYSDTQALVAGYVLVCTTFTSELWAWRPSGPRAPALRARLERRFERMSRDPEVFDRLRLPSLSDAALLAVRLGFGRDPSASQVAFTHRLIHACPAETFAAAMVGLRDFDVLDRLGAIDVPVLICAGDRDLLTPAFLAQEMARRIPDAEILVYPGAGHMVMLERHREFTAALRSFCDRALAARGAEA